MTDRYEAAIVGAGPAGSALAIHLADIGRSVVLVEAGSFDVPRIGESLAPGVEPLLRDLGAWETLQASEPIASFGTKSRWAGDDVDTHSHLFSTYLTGWHVDRRALDEGLARLAQDRGATLLLDTPIRRATYDTAWRLATSDNRRLDASVLVDATGRSGRFARMLGARRAVFDHLVGVGRVWEEQPDAQPFVGVEAVDEGWWYSAPLPKGGLITMLMTDADLVREGRLTKESCWQSALAAATLTRERIGNRCAAGSIKSHAANTSRMLRTDHQPWLAVGDAALSVDPLTGSGLIRALATASDAAPVVDALITGERTALQGFERRRDHECQKHLHERLDYYASCRLHAPPFWARRRAVADRVLGTA